MAWLSAAGRAPHCQTCSRVSALAHVCVRALQLKHRPRWCTHAVFGDRHSCIIVQKVYLQGG